jgi:hypothetical protein
MIYQDESTEVHRCTWKQRGKGCIMPWLSVVLLMLTIIQYTLLADTTNNKNKNGFQDDSLAIMPSNPTIYQAKHLLTAPFSFSACLIIKDDNIILPEWLAYHYTVLPLHRLIVGVDTLSHTDPTPILDAYQTLGMNITTWKNDSFWKDGESSWAKKDFKISSNTTYDELRERKRHRQNVFYEACLRQLHDENRTWTMIIDADEYLAFNYYENSEKPSTSSVYRASGTRSQLDQSSSVTMADVINHWDLDPGLPCVTFARYVFVSIEKEEKHDGDGKDQRPQQSPVHPTDFNTTLFHTLRYRQRRPLTAPQAGKSIVDASRYDGSPVTNPHRIKNLCTSSIFPDNKVMPFRVHHYVGSWEAFRSPGFDPRGRSYFDKRNNVKNTVEDSTMSIWLDKFATLVGGREKAIELTQQLRLHEELEMERKIIEQQQQLQFDWDKLNTKTERWL